MRTIVSLLLAIALAGNGVVMLWDPAGWYGLVPGVPETGPLNPHFVRDIGCAYTVTGVALACFAIDARARAAALAGGAFLALHALVHAADLIGGREPWGSAIPDLVTVVAPAVIVLWAAFPPRSNQENNHAEHAEMADPTPARRVRAGE